MSEAFDPYRKWLGIPPKDQPPNHYRLLAIDPFEDDPEVIEIAADQRMALLRSFQTGAHSALSQTLLNDVSSARICLLDPSKKATYDAELRARLVAATAAVRPEPATIAAPAAVSDAAETPNRAVLADVRPSSPIATPTAQRESTLWALAGILAAVVISLAGFLVWANSRTAPTANIVVSSKRPRPPADHSKSKPAPDAERSDRRSNSLPPPTVIPMGTEPRKQNHESQDSTAPGDEATPDEPAPAKLEDEESPVSEPDGGHEMNDLGAEPASLEKPRTAGSGVVKRPRVSTSGRLPPASESGLPPGVRLLRDLKYGKRGDAQLLDLYLPMKFAAPAPLVIWIHGGGWEGGSKESWPVIYLVDKGYAVASINYRLSDEAKFPAQIHDCKAAVRWLRANAKRYGINQDRFGVWGQSAGGHLAALLGTSAGVEELEGDEGDYLKTSSRVQAVCDWCGPTDLERFAQFQASFAGVAADYPHTLVTKLLGGEIGELKGLAEGANPIVFVSSESPPFLIMHGDGDDLVPLEQSQLLKRALQDAHADVDLRVVPGWGHELFNDRASLRLVETFFGRALWDADEEQASKDARLVATYTHEAGNLDPRPLEFYSNGRLESPDSGNTWLLRGDQLVLCWYHPGAGPFGIYIDICTLSKNGDTYEGWNQDGAHIGGEKTSGDNLKSADRPKASK